MKIFVTGGSGFVGKHVVNKLAENRDNELSVLSRSEKSKSLLPSNIKIIVGDLSNINEWADELRRFQPEVTIHLAWQGIPDHGYEMSYKNLTNSLNLFVLLREIQCKKIICPGSCWEYGQKTGIMDEKKPLIPTDPFTAAKVAIYLMGQDVFKDTDTKFIWARFFYVYGPGQRAASLIPHIIKSVSEGKKPDIRTPNARNDFVYVKDVADALHELVLKGNSGIYNIGYGSTMSVKEIIGVVSKKMKFNIDLNTLAGVNEEKVDFWADLSKIKADTGWTPKTDIKEGIENYIDSLKNKNL